MGAPYTSLAIANTFIDIADKHMSSLTPIKVQKLVYFAHGWHLALRKAPLVCEPVEAFPYGPALRALFDELRFLRCDPIPSPIPQVVGDPRHIIVPLVASEADSFVRALLERIWVVYGQYSEERLAGHLSRHGSPWRQTRARGERYLKDDELVAEFASALRRCSLSP